MHIEKKTLKNIFLGVGVCIVLYWALHEADRFNGVLSVVYGILSPFVIGAVLAFILNVPMRAIESKMGRVKSPVLRRTSSIILTLLFVVLVLTLVFCLLIPQLIETIQSLIPKLQSFFIQIESNISAFLADNPKIMAWITANTDFEKFDWAGLAQRILSLLGNSVSAILSRAFLAIGGITGAVMDMFISLVFAFYCLAQKETLARQGRKLLYAFLPESFSDDAIRVLRLTNRTFSNFLSGQCIEVCILGAMFAVSMAIFRLPYIPLVSVLIAVTAFIPIVGAWIGCACGAFLILVANPMQAVGFVIMFLILQQIENNLIYPKVVGTSIGLSGMWVLVAVAVGGELFGVVGMFLMIPVTAVLYTLLQEKTRNKLEAKNIDPEKLKPVIIEPTVISLKVKKEKKSKK